MFPVEPISGKMLDYYVGRKDSFLIDLRNPKEYHTGHIKGAVNVPYETGAVLRPGRGKSSGGQDSGAKWI